MKQEYAEKKCHIITAGQIYQCGICEKKFKSSDFVHKHIFNKHADTLDQKFNKYRFDEMLKENYLSDPKKMINQPVAPVPGAGAPPMGGGYQSRGGYQQGGGRGGFRRGGYDGGQ